MTKYILTVDTMDGKTHSFECDLCTAYDDDMLTYSDFWDQHHPITNHPGMSSKDAEVFQHLWDTDQIESMEYSDAIADTVQQ